MATYRPSSSQSILNQLIIDCESIRSANLQDFSTRHNKLTYDDLTVLELRQCDYYANKIRILTCYEYNETLQSESNKLIHESILIEGVSLCQELQNLVAKYRNKIDRLTEQSKGSSLSNSYIEVNKKNKKSLYQVLSFLHQSN